MRHLLLFIKLILSAGLLFSQEPNSGAKKIPPDAVILKQQLENARYPSYKNNFPKKISVNNEVKPSTHQGNKGMLSPINNRPLQPLNSLKCTDTAKSILYKSGFDTLYFRSLSMSKTGNGDYIITGNYLDFRMNNRKGMGYAMRIDSLFRPVWVKKYPTTYASSDENGYYLSKELNDKSILLIGFNLAPVIPNQNTSSEEIFLTRIDQGGSVIWSKTFKSRLWDSSRSYCFFDLYYVTQDTDNNIYICGKEMNQVNGLQTKGILFKVDMAGNMVWDRNVFDIGSFSHFIGFSIVNDKIVTFGAVSFGATSVYVFDKNSGDTISMMAYKPLNDPRYNKSWLQLLDFTEMNNSDIIITGRPLGEYQYPITGNDTFQNAAYLRFNKNSLDFEKGKIYGSIKEGNGYNTRLKFFPDERSFFMINHMKSNYSSELFFIDAVNDNVVRERKKDFAAKSTGYPSKILQTNSGSSVFIHSIWDSLNNHTLENQLLQLNPSDTNSNCIGIDTKVCVLAPLGLEKVDVYFDSIPLNVLVETTSGSTAAISVNINKELDCLQTSRCDTIKLFAGADTICNNQSPVIIKGRLNQDCGSAIYFYTDSGKVLSMQTLSDSSIALSLDSPGKYVIYGAVNNTCGTVKDSISIVFVESLSSPNLGPDLQICGNASYPLNAGKRYKTYRWHNNSSDSIFVVTSPGLYHVTVQDFCGNSFSDSVTVTSASPFALSAGADTFKCNKDSITLTATAGFLSYSWKPANHISGITLQTVKVYPDTTTTYYLEAEKNPGCISRDTITITVYNTPRVYLGADTSICSGNAITLNAGSGSYSLQWNTGDTTQSLLVTQQGAYSVKLSDTHGCFSSDTFTLLNVYPQPLVVLNHDTLLCRGKTKLLDAGPGFNAYLWNNNSISQSVIASGIGRYWVTVTDTNSCKGSDTTEIKAIALPPFQFLSKDTAICTYESVTLRALFPFSNYLWSTGAGGNSIIIKAPGTYWLQVIDSNGCEAKEFITVSSKACPEAIFFPTAFSPGSNNLNDNYRPKIYGTPSGYRFTIFNRYGEKVFETNDYNKGWNGEIKGVHQKSGAFVWICMYQFSNGISKTEHGTFILVR